MISLVFLVGAGLLWGGLFLYKNFLGTQIGEKSQILEQARSDFAPALIQEIERLDDRIIATEQLLDKHLASSILFEILENTTLRTVSFDSLGLSILPEGVAALTLQGEANSFSSVALQADTFEDESAFINPVFSSFELDESGNVSFSFEAEVDPKALRYSNLLEDFVTSETGGSDTQQVDDSSTSTPTESAPADATGAGAPAS